jgi:hypothetical protein
VDTLYKGVAIDAFVSGDNAASKQAAITPAKDASFAECYVVGGND